MMSGLLKPNRTTRANETPIQDALTKFLKKTRFLRGPRR